jgi:hypothetical protein
MIACINCDETEKLILDKFNSLYTQRADYGKEYFEGDCKSMIKEICSIST